MVNVLVETEEAEDYPDQPDGLDLDIAQVGQVTPQAAGPGVLPQQVVSQQVLRLRLHLLQPKQDKVRADTLQQGGEIESLGELDGHVPGDQLEAA